MAKKQNLNSSIINNSNGTITSTAAGTSTITASPSGYFAINSTISTPKFKYNVLGHQIEIDGSYGDPQTAMCIALINVLGIKYYDELKKQNVSFSGKLGEFLEENLKSYYRDNKIEEVLN